MPYRWRIVALLFFLSVVNYLDRQTLSVIGPTLRTELHFSTVEYSYVVTSFLVAYTIGYFFCGAIIDRLGVRLSVALALAVWSLAGMAHAFAAGWIGLMVARFVLGLGESFNVPCGIKALAEWVPQRERGLSTAILSSGFIVGAVLAPPLVSWIALQSGWQWAFVVTGAFGFVYLAFWLRLYDSPERQSRLSSEERSYIVSARPPSATTASISIWEALRHPVAIGFCLARLLTDSLSYFFSFWLPEYLQHARGFTLGMIGLLGWIPFLAADVGGPGGGALSDWLVRRGWAPQAARRCLLLVAALLMPLALVAVRVDSAYAALGFIAVLLAAQSCWNSNLFTLMSELFPREHVATFVAVSAIGGSIGGILSTLLAGRVIQGLGYEPVFTVLGFLHLSAWGIIQFTLRRRGGRPA